MASYGNFPGVKITTTGGGISGVQVGEEEKLVIFAPGSGGTATVNDPTQINSLSDADKKFGDGSPLANAMKTALANGANREYLYGVQVAEKQVSAEDLGAAVSSHTGGSKIASAPLVEDVSTITLQDTVSSSALNVEFRFETNTDSTTNDFSNLEVTGTNGDGEAIQAYINPLTGEWVADSSSDYEISYSHYDYEAAFDAARDVLIEGDTGVYAACTEAPDVHGSLSATVTSLRGNYQMVQGVAGARPNLTDEDGKPAYEAADYTDTSDDDSLYLVAPARQDDGESVVPALAGLMAGHAITDPIYNDTLNGLANLSQRFTSTEADQLRTADVIPARQAGSIRIKANRSTGFSSNADWERDFWRRRIVDRVVLISKQVGDDTVGRINDDETRENARVSIYTELRNMVRNRLLKPNENGETNWMVEVTEDANNSDQVNIDVGITPMGVVKRIDETITINT